MNLSLHNDEADESLKEINNEIINNDGNEGDHFFDVNAPPVEDFNDDSNGGGKKGSVHYFFGSAIFFWRNFLMIFPFFGVLLL